MYGLAAWTGISGEGYYGFDHGGPDISLVSAEWISDNIQVGPLGSEYPDVVFIMEGDSPSILFSMQNGLNDPEHPEWGGWGGRYLPVAYGEQQYHDAIDQVIGHNGELFKSNQATVWRWRSAYQNEMAARMQWTLRPYMRSSNVTHPPVLVVNGSCGSEPLAYSVEQGNTVTLDASASYDPDGRALNYTWWQYRDISASQVNVDAEVPQLNLTIVPGSEGAVVSTHLPSGGSSCSPTTGVCQQYHVILQVENDGMPPMTRYRRVVLKLTPSKSSA